MAERRRGDAPVRADRVKDTARARLPVWGVRRAGELPARHYPEQVGPEVRRHGGGVRGARGRVVYIETRQRTTMYPSGR